LGKWHEPQEPSWAGVAWRGVVAPAAPAPVPAVRSGGELDKVQQAVILCCLNGVQGVNDRAETCSWKNIQNF
jgi:hypothetical protein